MKAAGFCIRCATATMLDTDKPLCPKCFRSWARFKNPDYPESHCHACGADGKQSVAKPLCRTCWKAHK